MKACVLAPLPLLRALHLARRCRRAASTTRAVRPTRSGSIERYGILRGVVLAVWRVLRCNPWSHGGYDPPEAQTLFSIMISVFAANPLQPLIDLFEAVLVLLPRHRPRLGHVDRRC